jgi:hypothetical protein
MIIISIRFKELSVKSYNAGTAEIKIVYADPEENTITKKLSGDDAVSITREILKEIKEKEQRKNYETGGKRLMDSFVHLVIENEDAARKQISTFIDSLLSKTEELQNKKNGEHLLEEVNALLGMKKIF